MPFSDAVRIGASGAGDYEVERSLRFNDGDSAYLSRTFGGASNRKTYTISAWVKITALGTTKPIFTRYTGNSDAGFLGLYVNSDNYIYLTGWNTIYLKSNRIYRDTSSWSHIVLAVDTTQSTSTDRIKLYFNGELQSTATYNAPSQDADLVINEAVEHRVGNYSTVYFDGYMAELNFVDGSALTPFSFGKTDTITGQWVPINTSGLNFGTNGFRLKFADNSGTTATTLGKDSSGNGNNFTPNNFSVAAGTGNDSMKDAPTNNFATFNSTFETASNASYGNGNLEFSTSSTGQKLARSTFAHNSGKWYAEFKLASYSSASGSYPYIGVSPSNKADPYNDHNTWVGYVGTAVNTAGTAYKNGSVISGGFSYAAGDIIGMAMDVDNLLVYFYKNGTIQNSGSGYALTSDPDKGYQFAVSFYANSGTWAANLGGIGIGSNSDANGHGNFTYSVPSGYLAECSANLPDPSIAEGNKHFNALIYTGNGTDDRSLTVGFQPDLTILKQRDATKNWYWYDSIRGANKQLLSNATNAEAEIADRMQAFESNGIQIGASSEINNNTSPYINYSWKGGGSTASNSDGSITSSVRANTTAGFSIVTYTGTGSTATVGHGLGVAPNAIFIKGRVATGGDGNWNVYHSGIGATKYLLLNSATAADTSSGAFNDTAPTSSVFTVNTFADSNGSTKTFVAYCFSEVAGYSKFGSYVGNNNADGTFVYLGFRPAWVMIKNTEAGSTAWYILDNKRDPDNPAQEYLAVEDAGGEGTYVFYDFLSNGFKLRNTGAAQNPNGQKVIYMAFAESPFKYARAR